MSLVKNLSSLLATLFTIAPLAHAEKTCPHSQPQLPPSLEAVWQVGGLPVPESVLEVKHKGEHYLLVSLIDGSPFDKDGQGGIAKLSLDGQLLDDQWASGLSAPKGMAVHGKWLYVADIDEVVIIDIRTGAIAEKIAVPGAVFLNDVAVDNRGIVYISDTGAGQIIRLDKRRVPQVYLADVPSANGLYWTPRGLLVGSGPDLVLYDRNRAPTVLASGLPYGIDGVAPVADGHLVSVWEGQIYWIDRRGTETLVMDSIDSGVNTADFAYVKRQNLIIVPNFFANTVTAYQADF